MKLRSSFFGLFALVAISGCIFPSKEPPESTSPSPRTTGETATRPPPRIERIDIPEWPPIGKSDLVRVTVADDRGGGVVQADFARGSSKVFSGTRAEVTFSGTELGEGLGLLRLFVSNREGTARLEKRVDNLLVDLSPPLVNLESESVSRTARPEGGLGGEVALLVQDAWVLGYVELSFKGKTLRHDLPKAYPATLGKAWDVSRITFPASDLPEGRGNAIIVAADAAGNKTLLETPLRIDGTAPEATIVSPANGTAVNGPFDLVISATDRDATGPVRIEVQIGGAPAAVLLGPDATLRIDPATLSPGRVRIDAYAIDEAGNRSLAAGVFVEVE